MIPFQSANQFQLKLNDNSTFYFFLLSQNQPRQYIECIFLVSTWSRGENVSWKMSQEVFTWKRFFSSNLYIVIILRIPNSYTIWFRFGEWHSLSGHWFNFIEFIIFCVCHFVWKRLDLIKVERQMISEREESSPIWRISSFKDNFRRLVLKD